MTTRTVRHPALAQNLRYACNPPIHEGSPLTKVRGAGGEKRQHLPLDTEHGHYFSSLLEFGSDDPPFRPDTKLHLMPLRSFGSSGREML